MCWEQIFDYQIYYLLSELGLEIAGDVESGNEPRSESLTNKKSQNQRSGATGKKITGLKVFLTK